MDEPRDVPMTPVPPAEAPQAPPAPDVPGPLPPAATATEITAAVAAAAGAAAIPVASTCGGGGAACVALAAAAAAGASRGALLAASLVRSRATYFERLSSSSSRSASASACTPSQQDAAGLSIPAAALAAGDGCPAAPRHSTALAGERLHPLAPHPLSVVGRPASGGSAGGSAGRGASWRDDEQQHQQHQMPLQPSDSGSGIDEDDSVDTFFDKPSYTCYGAAVELSPASSYGGAAPRRAAAAAASAGSPPKHAAAAAETSSAAAAATAAVPEAGAAPLFSGPSLGAGTATAAPAGPDPGSSCADDTGSGGGGAAPACAGYVRSMSAHFARVSGGSTSSSFRRGSGAAGMDGLFDDLVTHVGALLASHPDVEAQMGMVQGLSDRLLELHALCETLGRKEDEVEHLRGVLCELTSTRAEAIRLKVQMAESLNGLQQEYYKVLRSAQLAQGTCKQHSARAATTRKQLLEAQSELLRYKRAVASLCDRNRRLRSDNEDMAARLHALEQGRLGSDGHRSACYLALLQAQTPVLY